MVVLMVAHIYCKSHIKPYLRWYYNKKLNSDFLMNIPYFWNPNNHNGVKKPQQLNKK